MDTVGIIDRFQEALKEHLEEPGNLEVFVGQQAPGPGKDYREGAMALFFVDRGQGMASERERKFVEQLLNGDWRKVGVIQHYCMGPSCCNGGEPETRRKLVAHMGKFLFPTVLPRISQHRWTGLSLSQYLLSCSNLSWPDLGCPDLSCPDLRVAPR